MRPPSAVADPAVAELRLMQLASPALPVGAFAHSEGLESAVAAGWVRDEASAGSWVLGLLAAVLARLDAPVLARLHAAFATDDDETARAWSRRLLAARATLEVRESDVRMGRALARVLATLGVAPAAAWTASDDATFAASFAMGCAAWGIEAERAARGYLWTWCENQIGCAVKLVPLGQSAGQRLLARAGEAIPALARTAVALPDAEIGASAPGAAIASARHETQRTRLFRS